MGDSTWDIAYGETWGPSYDATTKLFDMTYEWGSGEPDAAACSNLEGMDLADFRSTVRALATITDEVEQQDAYTDVLTLLNEEAVFLPISHKRQIAVTSKGVSGFQFGTTEYDIPVAQLFPTPPPSEADDDGLSSSALAGITVGALSGLGLLMLSTLLIVREKEGNPIFYSPVAQSQGSGSDLEMAVKNQAKA
jgi:hypothetical protein